MNEIMIPMYLCRLPMCLFLLISFSVPLQPVPRSAGDVIAYVSALALSILLDVVWCGLYAPGAQGAAAFGLVMTIFNLILKLFLGYFGAQRFVDLGGSWSLANGNAFAPPGSAGPQGDYAYQPQPSYQQPHPGIPPQGQSTNV